MYFEWVKNQAFESQFSDSNSALNAECVFDSNVVNNTTDVTYTRSGGLDQSQITLGALESEVVEFTLQPASEPYLVSVILSQPNEVTPRMGQMYQDYGAATDACLDPINPYFTFVSVQPGEPETVYGLLANPSIDTSDSETYTFRVEDQDADVSLDITQPADGSSHPEGTLVNFETDITASEGIDEVVWRSDGPPFDGDVIAGGESPSVGLLCPGDHNITATVTGQEGLQDSDEITITMENQPPSITFDEEPPNTIGTGDYLVLEANASDQTCTGSPTSNDADQSLIEWDVDGFPSGVGPALTHQVVTSAGGDIDVQATYTDDAGATTTAGPVTIDVVAPPPGGYPPKPVITQPTRPLQLRSRTIQAEGRAVDAEDGRLEGEELEWEIIGDTKTVSLGTGEDPPDFSWPPVFDHGERVDIRLTVTDTDGNTASDMVSVELIGGG